MANSNSLFTVALIGGAAYLVYNWWTSQPVAAAAPAVPVTPTTPAAPVVAYVPPTQAQQLQTAAGGSATTTLNADQWSFYWQQLGLPTLDGTKWQNVFFPNGRPANGAAAPTMTAQAYVSALQGAGLAGYRQGIPVPTGRGMGAFYSLEDLRRAGRR